MSCAPTHQPRQWQRPRILYAVTGSVAAVKGPEIAVRLVHESECDVRVLLTRGGENFWSKAKDYNPHYWNTLQELLKSERKSKETDRRVSMCYADDEWKEWQKLGDPVLHIDLRDWADVLLVAPLSAHTLAKIAHGFCDDTLSCVIRAWDFGHGPRPAKPLLLAPAMNTAMWDHPLTQMQLHTVRGFCSRDQSAFRLDAWVHTIPPQVKTLACGEIGNGALASVDEILRVVSMCISEYSNNNNNMCISEYSNNNNNKPKFESFGNSSTKERILAYLKCNFSEGYLEDCIHAMRDVAENDIRMAVQDLWANEQICSINLSYFTLPKSSTKERVLAYMRYNNKYLGSSIDDCIEEISDVLEVNIRTAFEDLSENGEIYSTDKFNFKVAGIKYTHT